MESIIAFDVNGTTKEEVIQNLAKTLFEHGKIKDLDRYIEAVKERETEITTGFGNGIAIPHGKTDAVKESSFVFGKLKNEVDWNSMDHKPVNMVFMLAIPTEEAGTTHLRMLSKIAVSIMDEDFVEQLRLSNDEEQIKDLINTIH
ncbi:PTS sugar transporter subunit IIA [Floccifex sp.]|uniref:PTS sugar transporter subunit IIA n=1 Tax=Floccifex sp. TaxID=2815810 RepID=UPI003F0E8720